MLYLFYPFRPGYEIHTRAFMLFNFNGHRRKNTGALCLTVITVSALLAMSAGLVLPTTVYASAINASSLIDMTNQVRQEANLKPLEPNHKLTQAAYRKAYDILNHGYFAHTNPSGKPFYQWVEEENYNYLYAGENLAIDFTTNEGVLGAWLQSPSHRANIINPNYNEIGLVTLRGSWQDHETTVVVQMFGSILTESPTVLGRTLDSLAKDFRISKNDLTSLAANLAFLPSLAGRKYFDVIVKPERVINLALSNPTSRAIAQSPITKVPADQTYQTLLKSENACCQNEFVFALTEAKNGQALSTPITYPSLRAVVTNFTLPILAVPAAPKNLSLNFFLAGLIILLLIGAHHQAVRRRFLKS